MFNTIALLTTAVVFLFLGHYITRKSYFLPAPSKLSASGDGSPQVSESGVSNSTFHPENEQEEEWQKDHEETYNREIDS